MKIYVLAAGYATRLYPLTEDCAKPLLEVGDRPILSRILDQAHKLTGITQTTVIHNQRFAADFERWEQGYPSTVPIALLNDGSRTPDDRLGAVGDLAFGLSQVPLDGEDWLVIAGDNLLEFDLAEVHDAFQQQRRPTLILRERGPRTATGPRYNEVHLAPDGSVARFIEKPESPTSPLAAIAVYFFTPEVAPRLHDYARTHPHADAPGHFVSWLARQMRVGTARLRGEWHDIGDLESLKRARERDWRN